MEGTEPICAAAEEAVWCKAASEIATKKRRKKEMRYRIRLDTMAEVNRFVGIAGKINGKIVLTDGDNFTVNGKSLLGAMYTFEWDRIFCESDHEIYHMIKDFIVDESEVVPEE